MKLPEWEELPSEMRTKDVRPYYEFLVYRSAELRLKRIIDVVGAGLLMVGLGWFFVLLAVLIKIDSPGPVFFRQQRVTQFGREFSIHKFRTMGDSPYDSDVNITVADDPRVTRTGAIMRRYRLDEFSQLIDILQGNMTFVGTRPEVPEYVREYSPEMYATLLLPAGVTSTASIRFKDEAELLAGVREPERVYIERILPAKMRYNLQDIRRFSLRNDLRIMVDTVREVFRETGEKSVRYGK